MKFDPRRPMPPAGKTPLTTGLLAGLVACALTWPLLAQAGGARGRTAQARPASEGVDQLIVRYRDGRTVLSTDDSRWHSANRVAAGRQLGLSPGRRTGRGAQVWRLSRRLDLAEAQALARAIQADDPAVEYAEPNRRLHAQFVPNDAYYASQQWDLFEAVAGIGMPTAWELSTGQGVVVAVVDTGVRPHADLVANLLAGRDFVSDADTSHDGDGRDADASDPGDHAAAGECGPGQPAHGSSWHGTHVAGTIAAMANNGIGVAGIAFGAKLLPVRALGPCGGTLADIADAVVWASGGSVDGAPVNPTPARVINLSLGGPGACGTTMQQAIDSARSRGTVVVAAAGNREEDASGYTPASCSGVITVAAIARSGARTSYSNYGSVVDLAAPGGDEFDAILSTVDAGSTVPTGDAYAAYIGTSMAAPHVAATAALMLALNPDLSPDELEARLKASSRPFVAPCAGCGSGLLDAAAAVQAALPAASGSGAGSTGGNGTGTSTGTSTGTGSSSGTSVTLVEIEPNDSRPGAQTLVGSNLSVQGSLGNSDVSDFYAVTLAAGHTLTATLTQPDSSAVDFDLYLYRSATGNAAARSTARSGRTEQVSWSNAGSGAVTVYLRATRVRGSGSYTLTLAQ